MGRLTGLLHFWPGSRSGSGVSCQEVVEMVTDYLEGALSPAERRRFEKHLPVCSLCAEYLAQMRETIRLAGRLTPEDLTPEMRADLMDLYRRWRAED